MYYFFFFFLRNILRVLITKIRKTSTLQLINETKMNSYLNFFLSTNPRNIIIWRPWMMWCHRIFELDLVLLPDFKDEETETWNIELVAVLRGRAMSYTCLMVTPVLCQEQSWALPHVGVPLCLSLTLNCRPSFSSMYHVPFTPSTWSLDGSHLRAWRLLFVRWYICYLKSCLPHL